MKKIDFGKIQKDIVAFRDERDWKQFHNPKDLAVSLVLEATDCAYVEGVQSVS